MGTQAKSSKKDKNRKSGQNLKYIGEQRHDKSHVRRLTRHLDRLASIGKYADKMAMEKLAFYKARLGARGR